jgi:hypothetical protein
VRDALDIAAAATAADRSARVDALYGRLSTVVPRMAERTGCLQVITIPEHASSLDPDYAAAAVAVNNFFRFFAVAGGTADVLDVVDFAERARSHRYPGPDAWFGPDNVHLNEVGRLVLTATITEAARRCTHTTLAYGRAGSFSGPLATKTRLPTGQSFATRAVPGWEFLPGRDIYLSTTAADGTFFAGTMNQMGNATIGATGDSMVIGAFHPDSNSFTNIRLKTDKGRETVYGMPLWQPRAPHAGDIGDLEAFNGGTAIAFTNAAPGSGFQNPDVDGYWPVFGILTKGPNGWGVAEGRDAQGNVWRNQWTPNQLVAGSRNQAAALKACGVLGPLSGDARDCRSLQEITVLPHSGDIIITQYFGDDSWSGQLVVLDVDPDPAIPGRFRVEVAEVFDVPVIPDPAQDNPAIHLWIAPLTVNVDPTSTPDDERFVMLADTVYKRVGTNDVLDGHHPKTVIEFSYNEHATGHKIRPVSAPVLTGDLSASPEPAPPAGDGLRRFAGLGYATYDAAGNLWASVGHGFDGMATVVWAKGPNGRRLSNGTCAFNGGLEGYELNLAGVKPAWAVRCDPDYRILQTETLNSFGLWFDSVTGNMVTSNGSTLQAIQAEGSGSEMRFRVSNVASTVSQAIAARTGPCPGHPEIASCTTFTVPGQAPTDRAGRSFSILSQYVPRELRNAAGGAIDPLLRLDQWVFSTDQTRLFGRSGPRLTTQPGGATVVEAEQTSTYDTTQIASGKTKLVDSKAFFVSCGGCGYAAPAPTSGFALGDRSGGGVRAETEVTYALVVPKAGRYRLSYRATDLGAAGTRRIRVRVDGTTIDVTTPITPDSMADVPGPVIALPAGTSTLRLSVPDAASAGWQLDRMTFTRQ